MDLDIRGIKKARTVASDALSLLDQVEEHLGGALVSLIKYEKIDQGDALVRQVSMTLENLQGALCEVYIGLAPLTDISGFECFMDIACDNILIDWRVQSEIKGSLAKVGQVQADIEEVLSTLDRLERENKN